MDSDYLKNTFRWLHAIWAIIGCGLSILLASATGGHPPGLVFVPVVIVIWIVGHALLWASRKLAVRGKSKVGKSEAASGKWPILLTRFVSLCGVVFIFGLFGFGWKVLYKREWQLTLVVPLVIWLVASLCFFGTLLRRDWSRLLAGSGLVVFAAILLYEMVTSFMRGYHYSLVEWTTAIILFALLALIGHYFLRASRIKAFFAKHERT